MSCPDLGELARTSTDAGAAFAEHVAGCERCRALVDDQRATRAVLARLAAPRSLSPGRRAVLAAEVLARADVRDDALARPAALSPDRRARRAAEGLVRDDELALPGASRRWVPALAIGIAVAAAAVLVVFVHVSHREVEERVVSGAEPAPVASGASELGASAEQHPVVASGSDTSVSPKKGAARVVSPKTNPIASSGTPQRPDPAIAEKPAAPADDLVTGTPQRPDPAIAEKPAAPAGLVVTGTLAADFTRDATTADERVTLRDGQVEVDATRARRALVVVGSAQIQMAGARASVMAKRGTIGSIAVFAGSVEVTIARTRRVIVQGEVWEPIADAQAAFRDGWTALRAARDTDAIAAFDRAVALDRTDAPIVAEDAAYWAAIAAERAGQHEDAIRRLTRFLARFPRSPRAAAARAAIEHAR